MDLSATVDIVRNHLRGNLVNDSIGWLKRREETGNVCCRGCY